MLTFAKLLSRSPYFNDLFPAAGTAKAANLSTSERVKLPDDATQISQLLDLGLATCYCLVKMH